MGRETTRRGELPLRPPLLFLFDLDGTLIHDGAALIPPGPAGCIRRLRERGHAVTLATGRMACATRAAAESAGIRAPLVCFNGGLVLDTRDDPAGRIVHAAPVSVEGTAFALARAGELAPDDATVFLYDGDRLLASRDGPGIDDYFRRSGVRAEIFAPGDPPRIASTKVLVTVPAGDAARLDPLEAALAARGDLFTVSRSLPHYLEANGPGVAKGAALPFLRGAYPGATLVAFGDSWNDLSMFRAADFAVAMGNAPAEVKAAADLVTAGAADDGIRRALEGPLGVL